MKKRCMPERYSDVNEKKYKDEEKTRVKSLFKIYENIDNKKHIN